jgi:hypothetical protein
VFFLDGKALPHGETTVPPSALGGCTTAPAALACVRGVDALVGERPYRFHTLALAAISTGVTF